MNDTKHDTFVSLPQIADGEDKSSAFANRIRKNYRHIRKWAKRTNSDCFRIYDREIHEYPLAIDFYAGRFCVHHFASSKESAHTSPEVINEVERVLKLIFDANPAHIFWKTRAKTKATRQYEKVDSSSQFFQVYEYGVKFKVNLADYLDTGLFLDHRETRQLVASQAKGKRLLNLFAYTCSFSVHAALAGAAFTKSVDMSNTYTEWGKANMLLNGLSLRHNEVVRADCLKFLDEEVKNREKYEIIIIDPPTISRSKKMDQLFDVQVDYITLIKKALKLLHPDGHIFFSTNSRKFAFDTSLFPECLIMDISAKTIPLDFHDPKIHFCWKLSFKKELHSPHGKT